MHWYKVWIFGFLVAVLIVHVFPQTQAARAASFPNSTLHTTLAVLCADRIQSGPFARQTPEWVEALVQLDAVPVTVVFSQMRARPYIPEHVARIAAQRQLERINADQDGLLPLLTAPEIDAIILGRTQRLINGIYILVVPDKLALVRQLPGVVSVQILPPGSLQPGSGSNGPLRPGQSESEGTVDTQENSDTELGPEFPSEDVGETE